MSNKHKTTFACCAYRVIIVPKLTARRFYVGIPSQLQRCVEIAAEKIEGVKIAEVEAAPSYMRINLIVPPQHAVSGVISQLKMRTHAMTRKIAISRGMLDEKDDYKTWCSGYHVVTANVRLGPKIAEYVRAAIEDDERMEARTNG